MKLDLADGWIPRAVTYALSEPVVELIVPPASSDKTARTKRKRPRAGTTMRIPLMDIDVETTPPDGFVFHLPRSGSTLVARMLVVRRQDVSLIEPLGLNGLLSTPVPPGERLNSWLRHLLALYVATHRLEDGKVFIKLSSWMTLYLDAFQSAFPTTPSCFLYRNPVEILVQILEREPGWMAEHARPMILGIDEGSQPGRSREQYCTVALIRFCDSVLGASRPPLAIDYDELPLAVPDKLAPHFALDMTPFDHGRMLDVARNDAKDPHRLFTPDAGLLRARASEQVREIAQRELGSKINAFRLRATAPSMSAPSTR